jgi:DNA-binding MurR/RpiR family transcriptional regulator
MPKDILQRIQDASPGFSKGQRRIAAFIQQSYDKAAFMTASRLGKTVDVSESTVVRFAAQLGYEGYPAMQRALQEMIRGKLTAVQRMEVAENRIGDQDILSMVMQADMENIRLTLEECDRENFSGAVDAIVGAKRIYLLGVRSSAAITSFLGFYFNLIFDNVVQVHSNSASEMFEQLIRVGEGDVVIGVSFPRYSRRTVQALRFARDRMARVIAITDCAASPLVESAHHTLLAKSDMASFVDSLVAPLSLVNALIVAVSRKKQGELAHTFETLEKIWDEYQVYEKVENEN